MPPCPYRGMTGRYAAMRSAACPVDTTLASAVLRRTVAHVEILPGLRGRNTFDPRRVVVHFVDGTALRPSARRARRRGDWPSADRTRSRNSCHDFAADPRLMRSAAVCERRLSTVPWRVPGRRFGAVRSPHRRGGCRRGVGTWSPNMHVPLRAACLSPKPKPRWGGLPISRQLCLSWAVGRPGRVAIQSERAAATVGQSEFR
jgi:hypothetical protein